MQLRLQVCIALLCAATKCNPVAVPAIIPAGQDLGLSALPDLPDLDFTYDAAYTIPHLSSTASIMACVAAMRELALLDMNSNIGRTKTWTHPGYPEVSVLMEEVGGSRSTVRFAMWLIQAAIKDIMVRQRYQTSAFLGQYRNVIIGRVQFIRHQHAGGAEPQITVGVGGEKSSSDVSFDLKLPSTTGRTASNDDFSASVQYLDKVMDKRDTFFTIIWLLMAFGSHGNEPLRVYGCNVLSVTAEVRTIWNSVTRPARQHYLLKAADMVNMVAHLAVVLVRVNHYREMNLIISEDGVEIARGAIRTRPLPGELAFPLTSNVTVS